MIILKYNRYKRFIFLYITQFMGIWKYSQISKLVPEKFQLSLNEGHTNIMTIFLNRYEKRAFKIKNESPQKIILKIETMNPNKSFKDRSLAFQVSHYFYKNVDKLLISSSGNAAISAASYVSLTNMKLAIFVSNKVNKAKLELLNKFTERNSNISIHFSKRPKSDAIKYSKAGNFINLRGSLDDTAIVGFKTIAYELKKQNPEIDAIFTATSSGVSAIGIYQGYKDLNTEIPKINITQTTKIHPIAKEFDVLTSKTKTSLADAISDRVAHRKAELVDIIYKTNGSGWVISDAELKQAREFLQMRLNIPFITFNGVLSFAGLIKALRANKVYKNPVCIITGI